MHHSSSTVSSWMVSAGGVAGLAMKSVSFVMDLLRGGGPRNVYILSRLLCDKGFDSHVRLLWPPQTPQGPVETFGARVVGGGPSGSLPRGPESYARQGYIRFPQWIVDHYAATVQMPCSLVDMARWSQSDVYIATAWQTAIPTYLAARRKSVPMLYFVQADERTFSTFSVYRRLAEKTYQLPVPKFTQSRWLKTHLEELYGHEVRYIGIGIDSSVFRPRRVERERTIFTVARSDPNKGFRVFARAMEKLYASRQDFRVLIAGEKRSIAGLRLGFPFTYVGWINDDNVLADLYARSIFVNTGLHEALPMPPLEAMASGSSVVVSDIPGAAEYARDKKNCLLTRLGDPNDVAEKVGWLLDSNELRERLAGEGVETARSYTWEQTVGRLASLINNVLGGEDAGKNPSGEG
jgi:glycosyltransferase involved in cell wall biosynthesis